MRKLFWGLILFFGLFPALKAQNLFLKHYSVEDGLLSSEIYAQVQDSVGYMWFATSRGVSRFDGLNFTNFTVRNGLPTNSIITMFLDGRGYIWFAGYDGSLSYYDGERIIPYKFLDTVQKVSGNYYINNLYVDSAFNVYFAPNFSGYYKIDTSGRVHDLITPYERNFKFVVKQVGDQLFFIRVPRTQSNSQSNIFIAKLTDTALYLNVDAKGLRRFAVKKGKTYYVSIGKVLYKFSPGQIGVLKTYDNEISGLYLDKNDYLWVSVLYSGVYVYSTPDMKEKFLILDRKSPIRILQDTEDSYWIPTTESGIYYLPSFNFFNYSEYGFSDFNILSVAGYKNNIYFSTFDQQLFHCTVNSNSITSIENLQLLPDKSFTVNDIIATDDGTVWFLGSYLVKYKDNKPKLVRRIWRGYSLTKSLEGDILVTTSYGFFKFCGDQVCFRLSDKRVPTSNSIYQDSLGTIWLGSINGLFSYKNDSLYFWGDVSQLLKSRINNISQYHDYILLATSGLGLIALNPQDSSLINITTEQGLTSDFITKILVEDSVIWLGTNKGLVKLTVTDPKDFSIRVENYTHTDGLYAEEVRDIATTNEAVFLATSKGLVSFFPDRLKKQYIHPEIIIDSVTIDGKRINPGKKIHIKANQRILTIYFKAISFRAGRSIVYRYKIAGYDDKWNVTKNRYIRLPNLPGGHYKVYIAASAEPNVWSPKQLELEIVKKEKFTRTTAFYLLVLFSVALIVTLISHFRLTTKRRELEHERQLMLAEQRALRSQMNPHFIFNALNSIRRFILENDMEKADYYLTSFATLMRRVLDNSRQNFITLENEIQTLQLYLELERMRFDESFTFSIDVDKQIDIHNWLIPPMIIQPFVENAIWHGLALKQGEGRVEIIFRKQNDKILCIVQDNGIGREKAKVIAAKRKGHKSTGLSNTAERMDLLYKLYGKKIDLTIIDLYDDDGQPAGTRVEILFPNFATRNGK